MNISRSSGAAMTMNMLGEKEIPFIFIIDFEMKAPAVIPLSEIETGDILYNFEGFSNCEGEIPAPKSFNFRKYPVAYNNYKKAFDIVMNNLETGNSYLLNLTFPTRIETDLSLKEIFFMSRAKYRLFYKDQFVLFSPEIFVKISDGIISSYPMKGTIRAEIEDAESKILEDEKELAEHITIVDLIRNDLSIVAKNVTVKKFRYIDRVRTINGDLLQVSSEITGELPDNWRSRLGEIIFSLLPAGSITGAPKRKTVEIIKDAESDSRGYYTGVCGYFDGESLNSGVMIRFIEKRSGAMYYRSGGGITVYSDPVSEYKEMVDKVYVTAG
jgi:para-aminobenzoate synthetase component 1